MPLGLGPLLDQVVTLLLLILAVAGGVYLYKRYIDPSLRPGGQNYSVPVNPSSALGTTPAVVQPPRPSAPVVTSSAAMHAPVTRAGRIKQWNYGPNGEVNGFVLTDGTLAIVRTRLGEQLRSEVDAGSDVTVTGYPTVGANNLEVINIQSVTAKGRSFR
ncbi:MAG: hypothetical protein ACLQVM_17385 [Terriglobia bacterium]